MGTVTVVNKFKEPNHIYCGRGTALGNPYVMQNSSEKERNRVCDEYEDWFYQSIDEPRFLSTIGDYDYMPTPIMAQLREIFEEAQQRDINLGCYCAPKRCHCDTIKAFIDSKLEEFDK